LSPRGRAGTFRGEGLCWRRSHSPAPPTRSP